MSNMTRIKLKIKVWSFLPGVKNGQGPLQTTLFLFIAVGFSSSVKEDEEGQQGRVSCSGDQPRHLNIAEQLVLSETGLT